MIKACRNFLRTHSRRGEAGVITVLNAKSVGTRTRPSSKAPGGIAQGSLPSAPSAPGYSARLAAGRAVQAAGLAVRRLDTIHHLAERAVAGRLVRSLHQPEEDAAPGKFPRVTAGTRLCRTKAQKIDLLTFDEVLG